jgi:hypothetical protein
MYMVYSHFMLLFCYKINPFSPNGHYALLLHLQHINYFTSIFFTIISHFCSKGFSHFFYFLYLCTLEILPIVVLLHLNFS